MKDDLVEKVARAMYEGHVGVDPAGKTYPAWPAWENLDTADITHRYNYRIEAAVAIRVVLEEAAKVAERYVIDENELHPDVPFKKINQHYKNAVHAGAQYIAAAIRALGEKP